METAVHAKELGWGQDEQAVSVTWYGKAGMRRKGGKALDLRKSKSEERKDLGERSGVLRCFILIFPKPSTMQNAEQVITKFK